MEILSVSTEKTKELARVLAKKIKAGDVIALFGDLGSGKTTFTSFLVLALGINKRVQSPTFVLLRKYVRDNDIAHILVDEISRKSDTTINCINHLDLYRLQTLAEIEDIGITELLNEPNSITIVEWPEIAESMLPEKTIKIYFNYGDDENDRKITIQNLY